MHRPAALRLRAAGAVLLALPLAAGCGGGDPDSAPSKGPSSSTASPTQAAQPAGANGVTVLVADWSRYADEPVVLAWKRTVEAYQASVNTLELLPRVTDATAPSVRRVLVRSIKQAWQSSWHVQPQTYARIDSLTGTSTRQRLVACFWTPSYGYYQSDGTYAAKPERFWTRVEFGMARSGRDWRVQTFDNNGTCPGGPPR